MKGRQELWKIHCLPKRMENFQCLLVVHEILEWTKVAQIKWVQS